MGRCGRLITLLLLLAGSSARAAELSGMFQLRLTDADDPASWLHGGSGLLRNDRSHDGVDLGLAVLRLRQELSTAWSLHAVAQAHPDPDFSAGFTEAYVRYNPLTRGGWEWRLDAGAFYPALSLENPGPGWTSPYLYTNSAINSWVGEELRTVGLQASVGRPGRRVNSPYSWSLVASVFKANDPAGTLLAWRGFALHDRQSLFNEAVPFGDNPVFDVPPLYRQANYVEPFSEVDGRAGYYLGVHWDYAKRFQWRLYHYDNNGDPAAIDRSSGQYAWNTGFTSAAWLVKFSRRTRLIGQWMEGRTYMGPYNNVDVEFDSHFLLLSHQWRAHRFSVRYDRFRVGERDTMASDPNDSDGRALALAWRFDGSTHWQLGAEVTGIDGYAENRALWGEAPDQRQRMYQVNLQYRF